METLASLVHVIDGNSNMTETALNFFAILAPNGVGVTSVINAIFLFFSTMIPCELEATGHGKTKLSPFGLVLRDLGFITITYKVVGEAPFGKIGLVDEVHAKVITVKLE